MKNLATKIQKRLAELGNETDEWYVLDRSFLKSAIWKIQNGEPLSDNERELVEELSERDF